MKRIVLLSIITILFLPICIFALAGTPVVPAPSSVAVAPYRFTYIQSFVLGVVEGLTEFLPVSSTGHLVLTANWLGMSTEAKDAVDDFNVIIQGAAILAIIGLYRKRIAEMWNGVVHADIAGRKMIWNLFISFCPAALVGVAFHHQIKEKLFNPVAIASALIVGGILMILLEWQHRRKHGTTGVEIGEVTWRMALIIGLCQIASLWPGTSRSMTTILGAILAGLSLSAAAEYSFLLALPIILAATLFDLAKGYKEVFQHASIGVFTVGMVTSAIVAAIAVKGFVKFLQRGGLSPFGWYRIAAGILVLWFVS